MPYGLISVVTIEDIVSSPTDPQGSTIVAGQLTVHRNDWLNPPYPLNPSMRSTSPQIQQLPQALLPVKAAACRTLATALKW